MADAFPFENDLMLAMSYAVHCERDVDWRGLLAQGEVLRGEWVLCNNDSAREKIYSESVLWVAGIQRRVLAYEVRKTLLASFVPFVAAILLAVILILTRDRHSEVIYIVLSVSLAISVIVAVVLWGMVICHRPLAVLRSFVRPSPLVIPSFLRPEASE